MNHVKTALLLLTAAFVLLASTVADAASDVIALAAGRSHSLYVTSDGKLWAMGANYYGQLGDGTTTNRNIPVHVASNVIAVSALGDHSMYLTGDGKLWAMGSNSSGQLGNDTTTNQRTPINIASDVIDMSAGYAHSLYVTSDGKLWATGANSYGQLGNNTKINQSTPVHVASNVVKAAAGYNHSLFVTEDKQLWGMGSGADGQLGMSPSSSYLSYSGGITPKQLVLFSSFSNHTVAVSAGYSCSRFVTDSGDVYILGYLVSEYAYPSQARGTDATSVNYGHYLSVRSNGDLQALGNNDYGQLGDGTTITRRYGAESTKPEATDVSAAVAGYHHSLYVTSDGRLWGMGANGSGQLGQGGTYTNQLKPVRISSVDLYVSPRGDDANDGLTPETAKRSLGQVLKTVSNYAPCVIRIIEGENEVFTINELHAIPNRVTVDLGNNAIIKFADNAGFHVEAGGQLIAEHAIFTHLADDSVGGDTNGDGDQTVPTHDKYTVTSDGGIDLSENCEFYYYNYIPVYGGTLSSNQTWAGRKTRKVTGSLFIPDGKTLTIEAGTVVKLSPGACIIVNSGGTLNVNGALREKVVFTSLKDDARGGDTNGDGNATLPQPGDWGYVGVAGSANIKHAELLYGAPYNESGIIQAEWGGIVNLDSCTIAHAAYDGLWNWGGTLNAKNTIITDVGLASTTFAGTSNHINCVFSDVSYIAMQWSGTFPPEMEKATYTNCAFGNVLTDWFDIQGQVGSTPESPSNTTFKNSLFWNGQGSASQDWMTIGQNGNIFADPLFRDAARGDFSLLPGSPAIDAADSTLAPATDYLGQPRMSHPFVEPTGIPDAEGRFADIGAIETVSLDAQSEVDLAAAAVSGPAAGAGDWVTVAWRVINVGSKTASGGRMDSVHITSADPAIGARDVFVGEKFVTDTIEPGETREYSATFRLPSAQSGAWAYKVVVNSNRGIFEGSLTGNNTCVSGAAFLVTAPALANGISTPALGAGETGVFLLDAETWRNGAVILVSNPNLGAFAAAGYEPDAGRHDHALQDLGGGNYLVVIPPRAAETDIYLALQNTGSEWLSPGVEVRPLEFKLWSIGTSGVPSTGVFDIVLRGTRLDEAAGAKIIMGANVYNAVGLEHVSPTEVIARFELSNAPGGGYSVQIADTQGGTSQLAGALTVIANAPWNQRNFYARIEMPDNTRPGRESVAYFVYGNNGQTDLPAPKISILPGQLIGDGWLGGRQKGPAAAGIGGEGGWAAVPLADKTRFQPDNDLYLRLSQNEAWQNGGLEIFATSATHPVSMLKPGEERRVPIFYKETSSTATTFNIAWKAAYEPNTGAYPWDANTASMRPAWAGDEVWGCIVGNLRATIGDSWDACFNKMRANLDYLASQGHATNRAAAAWQMEVNNAIAPVGQPAVLASGMDIGVAVRGGSIGLNRIYASSLRNRFTQGIFGYGWTHGYDYSLQLEESQKRLHIHAAVLGTLTYTYEKAVNGVPAWEPEDKSNKITLVEQPAEYVLADRAGNIIRLDKTDGRILAATDPAGNTVSFEYIGSRLAAVRHSDQRHLLFTYTGNVVSRITDDQGRSVSYSYNSDHLATATDDATGNQIAYAYHPAGTGVRSHALTQVRFPDATTADFLYDTLGRVAAISQNGNQQTVSINYESTAVISTVDAAGALTRTWYGPNGKPLATQDAIGGVSRFNYDADRGLLASVTLPNGTVSRIEYDADNNPSASVSPTGKITRFASDAKGLLASFTDARGNTTRYNRDAKGNTLAIVSPDGSARTFTYDNRSQLTAATNRRGQNIALEYDDYGRVVKRAYPDGRTFTYTYNARNQLLTAADTLTGAITFTYDAKDRLQTVTYPGGKSFAYHYDTIGRLVKRVSEDGFELRYSYAADGNLLAVADKNDREYARYTFDADTGCLAAARLGNNTRTSYTYD
ncbi:MAG: hypothetical protein LBM92_09410, partial [Opitutaceae bacterium]|nr:hypothetical protein [Opitutaceae bacterium]